MDTPQLASALSESTERLVHWLRLAMTDEPLSSGAASLLRRLRADGPQRIADLAHSLGISQPGVTQIVDRLSREGLVRRAPSAQDRRATLVHLTGPGRTAIEGRRTRLARRLEEPLAALDEDARDALARALPVLDGLVAAPTRKDRS